MKYIEITRPTWIAGEPAKEGDVFEVDDETAFVVCSAKRAKEIEKPEEAVIEPPKKAVKLGAKKKKKDGEEEAEKPKE